MKNKEIYKEGSSRNITEAELEYYNEKYEELNDSFKNVVSERIEILKQKFNIEASYSFDIKSDFQERNMGVIISYANHTYFLNLFNFEIILNNYNNDIKNYILGDNILQLATIIKNKEIVLDLKSNIKKELDVFSSKIDNKVIFNMLTTIPFDDSDYYFENNKQSFIQIHFERCLTSNKEKFDNLLKEFGKKYDCIISYIANEIIFGSYLQKHLTPTEYSQLKKIRDKNSMNAAVFYSDISNQVLKEKVYNIIKKYTMSTGFGFNDV